jgi:hypothetical protein
MRASSGTRLHGGATAVFEDTELPDHLNWSRLVADYRIGVEPDPGPSDK